MGQKIVPVACKKYKYFKEIFVPIQGQVRIYTILMVEKYFLVSQLGVLQNQNVCPMLNYSLAFCASFW